MKPSHLQTPRTMNDGVWTSGYQSGPVRNARAETAAAVMVAISIGIGLAMVLVAWWSS